MARSKHQANMAVSENCHSKQVSRFFNPIINPIINAPNSKTVLPSAAQTRNSTGLKIYTCILLTQAGDQKVF